MRRLMKLSVLVIVKIGTLDTILAGPEVWVNDSQPFVAV